VLNFYAGKVLLRGTDGLTDDDRCIAQPRIGWPQTPQNYNELSCSFDLLSDWFNWPPAKN